MGQHSATDEVAAAIIVIAIIVIAVAVVVVVVGVAAETGEHHKTMPMEPMTVEATIMKAATVKDGEVTSLKSTAPKASAVAGRNTRRRERKLPWE